LVHRKRRTGILLKLAGFSIEKFKFKPAFPSFFRDRGNIKYFIENTGGKSLLSLMRLYFREYLGKPVAYLISKDRIRRFSNNIAAYATRVHD
jgi:hypothetical protein